MPGMHAQSIRLNDPRQQLKQVSKLNITRNSNTRTFWKWMIPSTMQKRQCKVLVYFTKKTTWIGNVLPMAPQLVTTQHVTEEELRIFLSTNGVFDVAQF